MIQLALETTGKSGSLSVLDAQSVLLDRQFGLQSRAAAEITVELDAALRWCEDRSIKPDWISVAVGPGSFTGLRIAITTAKMLAYALELPVVAVGSLSGIAAATPLSESQTNVLVGLNAYRNQVFVAEFSRQELSRDNLIHPLNHRASVCTRSEWDAWFATRSGCADWAIAADRSILSDRQAQHLAPRGPSDAVGVGLIATRMVSAAKDDASLQSFTNPFSLGARYLKSSAAEEKAALR